MPFNFYDKENTGREIKLFNKDDGSLVTTISIPPDFLFDNLCNDNIINFYYPSVKNVYFNDPATVVLWSDGTKTIVKAQPNEHYDNEKGLAMCFMKKAMGNKGNFNDQMNELIDPDFKKKRKEARKERHKQKKIEKELEVEAKKQQKTQNPKETATKARKKR